MSNDTDALIDAIQRIAWAENRYQTSFLNAARKRGTLPAETGRGGSTEPDCCNADNQGSTNDGSNKTNAGEIPDDGDLGDHLEQLCGLTDCETGQTVCVNFSGTFEAPEGWDNLNSMPDDSYIPGQYWLAEGIRYSGHRAAARARKQAAEDANPYEAITFGSLSLVSVVPNGARWIANYTYPVYDVGELINNSNFSIPSYPCGSITADYCTVVPVIDEWPSDGIPQIALIDGSFVSHKNDPDGADYLYPQHDLTLCDSAGKQMRVVGDKFGGFMTIPTDPITGEPLADAVISRYNTNGDRISTIGADEVPIYELPPLTE